MKKILVIAAHPDDEILGLGGTVKKLVDEGNTVECLILGEGLTSRKSNPENKTGIDDLQKQSLESGQILGFSKLHFENLLDNRFDDYNMLDVVKKIEKYIKSIKPEVIFTHHYGDLNKDHRITFDAVQTATRPMEDCLVKEIYLFETPSSTEWNFKYRSDSFTPNYFVDVTNYLDYKLKAMECYKSEIRDFPHPRSLESLEIIAKSWGIKIGKKYVEAFEVLRVINS